MNRFPSAGLFRRPLLFSRIQKSGGAGRKETRDSDLGRSVYRKKMMRPVPVKKRRVEMARRCWQHHWQLWVPGVARARKDQSGVQQWSMLWDEKANWKEGYVGKSEKKRFRQKELLFGDQGLRLHGRGRVDKTLEQCGSSRNLAPFVGSC